MKTVRGCAVAVVLLILATWVSLFVRDRLEDRRLGRVLMETGVSYAVWSKNGKALYYVSESSNERRFVIVRYDVRTHRKTRYEVPPFDAFDISPDEKSVAYTAYSRVFTCSLQSGKARRIYPRPGKPALPASSMWVYWPSPHHVFFSVLEDSAIVGVASVNILTKRISRIPGIPGSVEACASDGSGMVVYRDRTSDGFRKGYAFYDLTDKTQVVLDIYRPYRSCIFSYVSRDLVVYAEEGSARLNAMRPGTRSIYPVPHISDDTYNTALSPRLSCYWKRYRPRGEWSRSGKLYLYGTPDSTVELFHRIAARQ